MQPEQRKRRQRADDIAHARLLIKAHLGWLGGYPLAAEDGRIEWRVREPGPRFIDRAALARSTRAFKRLLGEYQGVLAAVVGDVGDWVAAIEVGMTALKDVVHRGSDLYDLLPAYGARTERAGGIAGERPTLQPLLAALSWVDLASPAQMVRDLRLIEQYAASFEQLMELAGDRSVDAGLGLLELARGEKARVAGLMRMLGDPDLAVTPTSMGDYADKIARRLDGAEGQIGRRPAADLGPAVLALVEWIRAAAPPVRRAALRATAAAELPRYLGRWRLIWTALEPAELLAARSREARERAPVAEVARCRNSVTWIAPAAPTPVNGAALRRAIQRLAATDARGLLAIAAGCPDDDELPVRVEVMVGLAAEVDSLDRASVGALVALLSAYFDRLPDPLAAWRALVPVMVAPRYRMAVLLGDLLPPNRWRELGEAMAERVAGGLELELDSTMRLAVLVAATGNTADALRLLPILDRSSISPWSQGIRAAVALGGADPDGFAELVGRMMRDDGHLATSVDKVLGATGPGASRFVRALVGDGETARLREAAGWIELARAVRGCQMPPLALPAAGEVPDWAARYPAALGGALAMAEAAGARADAERRLQGLFPDPELLRREIAGIDARLTIAPPHVVRRRANLVARLESPRPPSAARLGRLAAEIERGARATIFDRWTAAVERAALAALPRLLGLGDSPSWLASREHRAVFAAIARSKGENLRLARRLFAARSGPAPWDLRGEPANRGFLSRLSRRKIAAGPWIDGIGAVHCEDPTGSLDLALEDDPLEVLRMGEHFGTCLSPGGENFYSAVVNAVDINKRVVYARDPSGAVVGRCLLALTDAGRILTFHPYCHRGDFDAMMRTFSAELARRMGSKVVAHGTVTPLVASRWYDDGPTDLTGRHDFLAPDSTFREGLEELAIDQLISELEKHLGSLDGASLSFVVALSELDSRPELIAPLLPLLDRASEVPLEIRLRAIQLAERAGAADRLGPRTAQHLAAGLQGRLADGRVALEPIDRLAALAPVRLLHVVREGRRRLRPRERDGRPLLSYAAACAHRALGRSRRAAEEYARALAATSDSELRSVCRTALAAISGAAP